MIIEGGFTRYEVDVFTRCLEREHVSMRQVSANQTETKNCKEWCLKSDACCKVIKYYHF